jgi:hypothetical protein
MIFMSVMCVVCRLSSGATRKCRRGCRSRLVHRGHGCCQGSWASEAARGAQGAAAGTQERHCNVVRPFGDMRVVVIAD